MPIEKSAFENFFMGTCAELHVASLFYFAGYEASKIAPDTGVDYIVTNVARSKFMNEKSKMCEIQVKSSLLDSTGARYYVSGSELEFLCSGNDRFTVFVLFDNLDGGLDHNSFDMYADLVDQAIDRDIKQYETALMAENGRTMRAKGAASIFDFAHARLVTFWLNSRQMKRAKEDGLWSYNERKDIYLLSVHSENGSIKLHDLPLVPELTEIRYIMRKCNSENRFCEGEFSLYHSDQL